MSFQPSHLEPRRELGRTGFIATRLGIGDLADRSLPFEECVATLQHALSYGLNLVDTAPGYEDGYSEENVGAALRGRRGDAFVIDKTDHWHKPVAPQIDGSLRRLQMDHADLFVFHGLSSVEDWARLLHAGGPMEQLDQCLRAGKARFKGLSSHDPATLKIALASGLCDVVMFPVGPHVDAGFLQVVLPLARQRGVGTVCFKTFGAGKLLGDTRGYGQPLDADQPDAGRLSSTPRLPHLTVPECVHYTLTCDPDVTLLGMSTPAEIDAAVDAAIGFKALGTIEMDDVRRRADLTVQGKGRCHWDPQ